MSSARAMAESYRRGVKPCHIAWICCVISMTEHDETEPRMQPTRETPSAAEVTTEAANLLGGLGILTIQLMPLALPGLALLLPLVIPLLVIGLVALPFWLVGRAVRALARLVPLGPEPAQRAVPDLRPGTG
jgi:hypothetical protein